MIKPSIRVASVAAASLAAVTLAGCSASDPAADGASDAAALSIAASFYPFQYVAESVGGDLVDVVSLTPSGVEAHDVELSPATVRELGTADLALYLADFAPAVDDAIATTGVEALDATTVIEMHEGEAHDHDEEASDEDHADEDEHDHGATDLHFWLDPHLLAEYGDAVAEAFGELDPDNAATYTANAEALHEELEALDEAYATGLAQCERDTIIVSHEAFGYLAESYGLQQEGIAGLDPENEPSPARLLEIQKIIADTGATTVFVEDEVSASVSAALAEDAGVETAILDPGATVAEGDDYIAVMTRNLEALQLALGCE